MSLRYVVLAAGLILGAGQFANAQGSTSGLFVEPAVTY
jgi:hypothetical protein